MSDAFSASAARSDRACSSSDPPCEPPSFASDSLPEEEGESPRSAPPPETGLSSRDRRAAAASARFSSRLASSCESFFRNSLFTPMSSRSRLACGGATPRRVKRAVRARRGRGVGGSAPRGRGRGWRVRFSVGRGDDGTKRMTSRDETHQPACHGREHVFASAAGVLLGFAQGDGVGTGPVGCGNGRQARRSERISVGVFPGGRGRTDAETLTGDVPAHIREKLALHQPVQLVGAPVHDGRESSRRARGERCSPAARCALGALGHRRCVTGRKLFSPVLSCPSCHVRRSAVWPRDFSASTRVFAFPASLPVLWALISTRIPG